MQNLKATGSVNIPNNALSISNTSGLQTELNERVKRYILPDVGGTEQWFRLGALTTTQAGCLFQINIVTQHYFGNFLRASLYFSTSNSQVYSYGYDNTEMYCFADLQTTSQSLLTSADFAITQTSQTYYSFWIKLRQYPGLGFFTVMTSGTDTFAYGGDLSPSWPTSASMNPTTSNITPAMIGAATQDSPSFTGGAVFYGSATFNGGATFNTNMDLTATETNVGRFLNISSAASAGIIINVPGFMTQIIGSDVNKALQIVTSTTPSGTSITPLKIYANGVVNVGAISNANKMLVLHDLATSDAPASATNFYGLGVSTGSNTLRYQVPTTNQFHRFYCGTTLGFTITNTGGTPASDERFKTEERPIEDALEKIAQLQGKTFRMHGNEEREMGFVAQEVLPIVPEVVWIDDSDENRYHFLKYDKLTALLCEGIKELLGKVTTLEAKVAALEARQT